MMLVEIQGSESSGFKDLNKDSTVVEVLLIVYAVHRSFYSISQ